MNDQLRLDGNVLIKAYKHGALWHVERVKNLVVTTGRDVVRDLILNFGNAPNCLAVGKGTSTTTAGMTALETEHFRKYFTRRTSGGGRATYQTLLTTSEGNVTPPDTLREAGLFVGAGFNGAALAVGGTLFARTTFTPIAKDNTITITFTWDITITS